MTDRDAQLIYENQAEPDPDERNWREFPVEAEDEGEEDGYEPRT